MDTQSPQPQAPSRRTIKPEQRRRLVIAAVVLFILALAFGLYRRHEAATRLARDTESTATPVVSVTHPETGAPSEELTLPANIQADTETPIYARTSGYLRAWHFDIGAQVKKGDLLAEIDAPEVDEQLRQARADLDTAQANLRLASITARRSEDLIKTRAISTQERDNSVGAETASKAMVASKQADVARLERLQGYQKIVAPFDGIITARNTDTGALIDSGSGGAARELFRIQATDTLRVYVAVPEAYSRAIHLGDKANLTLDEFPSESFPGTIARTARAIDPTARTLRVEVDVPNSDGKLLAGSYGTVHFTVGRPENSLTIPSNTVIFRRDGVQVAVVRDSKAALVPIRIGRDYGDRVEVVSGLQSTDTIVLDPPDSLGDGAAVRVAEPKKAPAQ